MSYATPEQFTAMFGSAWLDEYLGSLDSGARTTFVQLGLDAATSKINDSLARGRFPSPLTSLNIAPAALVGTTALLVQMCCYLAVEQLLAGANDLPAGAKAVIAAAKAWLLAVEQGPGGIDGVSRTAEELGSLASGSVLFLPDGRGENFPEWQSVLARTGLY